jgi:MFS family permease
MMAPSSARWYGEITPRQWHALFAASAGWALDGMDVMLYAFALTAIQQEFRLSSAAAGGLASITLVSSGFGGLLFGIISDNIGRARALMFAILAYSIFTALTATASTVPQLILWRVLLGLGLGGEWAAGSVLVAETWPAEHRGKAISLMQSGWALGVIVAALVSALVLPKYGWRWLFTLGVLPGLLTLWIRRNIQEPEIWTGSQHGLGTKESTAAALAIFRAPLLKRTLLTLLMGSCLMFAYWGLFTWIPAYLSSPLASGGAGMTIVKSSSWIIPVQVGAFFGYIIFGFFADRFGRRPTFMAFVLLAAAIVPAYGLSGRNEMSLMILGPLVGFFGHGYFSVFGAILAELFPSHVRATAQGLCYNGARTIGALAPLCIGALSSRYGFGTTLASLSVFYMLGAAVMYFLPETRGAQLA